MTIVITVIVAVIIGGIVIFPRFASSQDQTIPELIRSNSGSTNNSVPTVQLLYEPDTVASEQVPLINLRGKIMSEGNIRLSSTAAATVKEIFVKRGQNVKSGDVLMNLGGNKGSKHVLEVAYEQAKLSKQNVEISIQNATSSTTIAIRQAEQQRSALNTSIAQLQKSLELTRNAGNYAVQGASLALNNLQNTIARSQNIRDLSGNITDMTLSQTQDLAQLAVQNAARSLLISLKGTVVPLLDGTRSFNNSSDIRSDRDHINDIVDNLDTFKDISHDSILTQIDDITGVLYTLLDTIESISVDMTKINNVEAKPFTDAWKQLSGTVTSSVAVSITQLSSTRYQIQNGPANKDLQLSTPDSQISASQDQQRVLEESIFQAQNAAALQEQTINGQIQNMEQQKITADLGIEAAKAAAKTQRDSLQGQLNIAEKQLEQAQIQLNQLTVLASMDGYVVDVPVSVNEDVAIGKELVTIYGSRPDYIRLSINPSDRERMKVGDRVMISLSNDSIEVPATVEKIAAISDNTGNIPIDCTFDNPQELPSGFVPGSNIQAHTTTSITQFPSTETGHFVPVSAIVIENGQSYVWLYQQGHANKRAIKIGPSQNDQVRILDTVDWKNIIINPFLSLQEGQAVSVSN